MILEHLPLSQQMTWLSGEWPGIFVEFFCYTVPHLIKSILSWFLGKNSITYIRWTALNNFDSIYFSFKQSILVKLWVCVNHA